MEGFKGNPAEKGIEHVTDEEFERQFKEDHYLEIEGNDPIPYAMVVPENPTSENWVVYVGGFSQGKESYLDEIKDLAESGRKVLFTNPTKGIEAEEEGESQVDMPETILNKSRAVDEILKVVGTDKVDLVGHSQGAAVITTFVAEHPGLANKMILECPAGLLEGEDSWYKVMGRFGYDKTSAVTTDSKQWLEETLSIRDESSDKDPKIVTRQVLNKAGSRAGKSFFKNLKDDFVFRLVEEIPGVAKVDIAPLLKEIKEKGEGTEVILVNANNDKVYSPERLEQTLGDNPLDEYIDRWAMYDSKTASHSTPVAGRAGLLRQILE